MLKILAIDPSGTGTTGACLINKRITFQEVKSKVWQDHLNFIRLLIAKKEPNLLLYETTNYINSRGKDMTSLFKLLGAVEGLTYTFTFKQIDSIPVHQVKDLKAKLLTGTKQIKDLTCQPGRGKGWMFKGKRISLHELDAYLVYWLWQEKDEKLALSLRKGGKYG